MSPSSNATLTELGFEEFPTPTYDDWRKEAVTALNGAPFEKKLVTPTPEGIDLQPIYHRADLADLPDVQSSPGQSPYLRGTRSDNCWLIAQELSSEPGGDFNKALRNALEGGQTAVVLSPEQVKSVDDFTLLLDGVDFRRHSLFLEPGMAPIPLTALLAAWLNGQGTDLARIEGGLKYDPLGALIAGNTSPHSLPIAFQHMALTTGWLAREIPRFSSIAVHTHPYHNAGGNAVQELAFALATGLEYIRQMESRGLTVDETASRIRFGFSIGSDFFMAIAKFRAARLLWSQVVRTVQGSAESQKMHLDARTSLWNRSALDPHVNLLRGTTEAFAAVAGGCDSLHVGAFDEVLGTTDEFSRRIARNTQIILRDECHFDHVVDPAGGSYYVETLTRQLAEKAWSSFQEIEALGGMTKALAAGIPQEQVSLVAAKKRQSLAHRRTSLVGVNVYANPKEKAPATRDRSAPPTPHESAEPPAAAKALLSQLQLTRKTAPAEIIDLAIVAAARGATLDGLCHSLQTEEDAPPDITPLCISRAAEPFEKLRQAVEASPNSKIFIVKMGTLREYKARADFSTGFFEIAGFEVISGRAYTSVPEAAEAAIASGARIITLCSTDEAYPQLVPSLAGAIKQGKPDALVVLAGYPPDYVEAFRNAGVDEFIHIRTNSYETLRRIAEKADIRI